MGSIRIRQSVLELGHDWAEPILWYARGVKAMQERSLENPTSWKFFGAIHGIWRELWDFYEITEADEVNPNASDTATYLDQCQHQSWYFLPWHRGYLIALENVLRHEIELLGGPHETWALPYWNYFAADQNVLPAAFRTADWPDGTGDNPLFVVQRWGDLSGDTAFDVSSETNLNPMEDAQFSGPGGGGGSGFGGLETGFNHLGGPAGGGIEMHPHNLLHGLIGGDHPTLAFPNGRPLPGLMSHPLTAALDPIFYLHHCNIDRLWESWNAFPAGKPSEEPTDWKNPTDTKWLDGPASIGEREFAMPKPDASKWVYTPAQMQSIAELGYEYDDLTPGAVAPSPVSMAQRMNNLGIPSSATAETGATMTSQNNVEMIGASQSGTALAGTKAVKLSVRTDASPRARTTESLSGKAARQTAPDRVFLNIENVTGLHDAVIFRVYVGLPDGADPADHKDLFAGSISLFGVSQASDPAGKHAGNGITYTIEISKVVDQLHLKSGFNVDELSVVLVPRGNVPDAAKIKVGRVSIYRQFE
ncbi:MAG: tyrosinase family protein [Pseudomonadota bacterium]